MPWGCSSPESLVPAPGMLPWIPLSYLATVNTREENLKNWQAGLGNVGKFHGIQQQVAGIQQVYAIKAIGTTSGLAHGTSKRLGQCQQPGVAIDSRNVQDTRVFSITETKNERISAINSWVSVWGMLRIEIILQWNKTPDYLILIWRLSHLAIISWSYDHIMIIWSSHSFCCPGA